MSNLQKISLCQYVAFHQLTVRVGLTYHDGAKSAIADRSCVVLSASSAGYKNTGITFMTTEMVFGDLPVSIDALLLQMDFQACTSRTTAPSWHTAIVSKPSYVWATYVYNAGLKA